MILRSQKYMFYVDLINFRSYKFLTSIYLPYIKPITWLVTSVVIFLMSDSENVSFLLIAKAINILIDNILNIYSYFFSISAYERILFLVMIQTRSPKSTLFSASMSIYFEFLKYQFFRFLLFPI